MCGIGGIVLDANSPLPDLERRLLAMRAAMTHRGPDDAGLYLSPDRRVGLVNCRLAIRDRSSAGHMPMASADGAAWITYNGEIYNAGQLRHELAGVDFRSTSDTEVLLEGYRAWGPEVVSRLRGMFAFAIFDTALERSNVSTFQRSNVPTFRHLFLARDRMGIKPLYYASTAEGFVFASELKAILASGLLGHELDPAAVVAYLMFGSVPCPLTIYQGVRALEPACTLSLALEPTLHAPTIRRYWELPCDTIMPADPAEAVAQVRALLEDAVRTQLVSDVPLGAFLSGGLDSASVVALMRAATDGPIRTCSIVFEEAQYSEASFAREAARAVGAEHYERTITARDLLNELDRILWAMDQPTIDGVNTYFVAKTAREAGLTVALSGLGGDELFGGYDNTFRGVPDLLRLLVLAQRIPASARLAEAAVTALPMQRRWAKVAGALGRPATPASAYLACRGLFSPAEVRALVAPDIWRAAAETFDPIRHITERAGEDATGGRWNVGTLERWNVRTLERWNVGTFAWVSRAELRTYTHHQLLRDTDAMSMAHSLEVRVPLLDHRLVEALLRLPAALKQANGHGPKPLLAAALGDRLPPLVRERREKRGFTFPLDAWLRGPLRGACLEQQVDSNGLLRREQVARVRDGYLAGRAHWARPWALAVLERWIAL